MTHDVACTTMATNTEFTTWDGVDEAILPETYFTLKIDDANDNQHNQQWMTKSSHFQLLHKTTGVAMWSHTETALPEWGFKQQEINGNKKLKDRSTFWIVDEIVRDPGSSFIPD